MDDYQFMMVRAYEKVSDEKRQALINLMHTETNISIKAAANRLGLKYENAKAIVKVYHKENRTKQLTNTNYSFVRHKINTLGPNPILLEHRSKEPEPA